MAALEAVGQIDIEPPLAADEREAFALLTQPSAYDVRPPGAHCGWVVCRDGCCLRLESADALDDAAGWLRWAVARLTEGGDHRLVGLVAACRREDGEIFTLRVTAQRRVHAKVLRAGRTRSRVAPVISLAERRGRR